MKKGRKESSYHSVNEPFYNIHIVVKSWPPNKQKKVEKVYLSLELNDSTFAF